MSRERTSSASRPKVPQLEDVSLPAPGGEVAAREICVKLLHDWKALDPENLQVRRGKLNSLAREG